MFKICESTDKASVLHIKPFLQPAVSRTGWESKDNS